MRGRVRGGERERAALNRSISATLCCKPSASHCDHGCSFATSLAVQILQRVVITNVCRSHVCKCASELVDRRSSAQT